MTKKIALMVGSLRKDSYSRKMAQALIKLAPESIDLQMIDLMHLQMYNQDLDSAAPAAWIYFRNQLREYDAVLFITPEHNRSVPAVLKNAIDIGSRPYGKSIWNQKPTAIVSLSIGAIGGFGANHHLRQSLVYLNAPTMPAPEAYIAHADKLFDANGEFKDKSTRDFMSDFLSDFTNWVEIHTAGATNNKIKTESAHEIAKHWPAGLF